MLLALLIIAAVWTLTLLMVVSLCTFAKRGDEALTVTPTVTARRLRALQRNRGARACDAPMDPVRR